MTAVGSDTECVGVLAPSGRDAALIIATLSKAGIECSALRDAAELVAALPEGLGAAVIAEEALPPRAVAQLKGALAGQPTWSDFPLVVLVARGLEPVERPLTGLVALGNVSLLDRPLRARTLQSAVASALRARRRQYEVRRSIVQRDRFLAMLGHELRNPLGAIVFASERAGQLAQNGDISRHLETVNRQARNMTRLVDDLLDVSRVTSGKILLERRPIDLRDPVRHVVEALQPWARSQHIELTLNASAEAVPVEGDIVRLEQVFNNLVTNAIKYTPRDGQVAVQVGVADGRAVVRVKDTGVGIEPQMLRRVFELFAQVETTLDRARGGMGIGLTLVRSLVQQHGGGVEAFSEGLGLGTELVVQLPRAAGSQTLATPAKLPTEVVGPMRLALVEDNDDIRETLKELLEEDGHHVDVAATGADGLAMIAKQAPEIAFVDIGLPGLDGYGVAEGVRRTLGPRVWLVAMTGYGQPEDRDRATKAGFDAHLTKPVGTQGLRQAMRDARRVAQAR